ncbi:MAG: hypothetical protein U1A72_12615 [Sulfuritalea sp.]|nr:hypothetical protein [Sulfuritalea sp.]
MTRAIDTMEVLEVAGYHARVDISDPRIGPAELGKPPTTIKNANQLE